MLAGSDNRRVGSIYARGVTRVGLQPGLQNPPESGDTSECAPGGAGSAVKLDLPARPAGQRALAHLWREAHTASSAR